MYKPILQTASNEPPAIRSAKPRETGRGLVDDSTFVAIEVDRLFDAVNHSETIAGQASLYRSLAQPLRDADAIKEKQDALRELRARPDLTEKIETLVKTAALTEKSFFTLLYSTFIGMLGNPHHEHEHEGYGYEPYRKGTAFMLQIARDADRIPELQSSYLSETVRQIRSFSESRCGKLMAGPAYKTERGMLTETEKRFWIPGFKFRPTLFKPWLVFGLLVLLALLFHFAPLSPGFSISLLPTLLIFALPFTVVYIPAVGTFDRDSCIYPLRDAFKHAGEVIETYEALGRLDELLSFLRFGQSFGPDAVVAELTESDRHTMLVKQVKSPILAQTNRSYVPNNIELTDERLTLITGPNSGGKTAFCKTIAQIQLLTQIGCPVPAESVRTTVADCIFYQIPEYNSLDEGEGRFGTELQRTKEIFLASSPKSLVILDELSEGTTYEEKLETSENILDGFRRKKNSTLLITHNHELVDTFIDKGIGQARQVEFKDDEPTFRLIEGISRVSHADRVAKKIGFSKEDINRYLGE
ncbi:MAG: DNA mismatch repair protein MutS [Methylococcaceae bacterium]|nr:DNA mismatch repair protein MutS [Methylococcaceae bacterium]